MDRIYQLEDQEITVQLEPKIVRVHSDLALWTYLDGAAEQRMDRLVEMINADYKSHFGSKLQIAHNSMVVEIIVHVYCDYLGLQFNRYVRITWTQKLVNKLLKRAEVVDCGEAGVDGNRWIWDLLAPFKKIFIWFLPDHLTHTNLKKA